MAGKNIYRRSYDAQSIAEMELEPEIKLWAAVIATAVADGLLGEWAAGTDQDARPESWELRCRCGGGCFDLVCTLAGLATPEVLRRPGLG
jgi:hypothetical protein